MKGFSAGLGILLTAVLVPWILSLLSQPKPGEKGRVRLPKFLPVLGVVSMVLFLIPACITAFGEEEDVGVFWAFVAFAALGASLIVAYCNCRIAYDRDGFTAKNFFGIKRRFGYDEITGIRWELHENVLCLGRRKVVIDSMAVGGGEFLLYASQQYRKIHKKPIPDASKEKKDLFNGHIKGAWECIFAYILVYLVILGFSAFVIHSIWGDPVKEPETRTLCFSACEKEDGDLLLQSSGGETARIEFVPQDYDASALKALCDGVTPLELEGKVMEPDGGEPYFRVVRVSCGGRELLSREEAKAFQTEEYRPLIFFPAVFFLVWSGFVIASVIVGRNPQKYPKLARKLFKPEAIRR